MLTSSFPYSHDPFVHFSTIWAPETNKRSPKDLSTPLFPLKKIIFPEKHKKPSKRVQIPKNIKKGIKILILFKKGKRREKYLNHVGQYHLVSTKPQMVFPTTKTYKKVVGAPHFTSIHYLILMLPKSSLSILAIVSNLGEGDLLELGATHLGSCPTSTFTIEGIIASTCLPPIFQYKFIL